MAVPVSAGAEQKFYLFIATNHCYLYRHASDIL